MQYIKRSKHLISPIICPKDPKKPQPVSVWKELWNFEGTCKLNQTLSNCQSFIKKRSLYLSPFGPQCTDSSSLMKSVMEERSLHSGSHHLQQRPESCAALKYSFMVETPTEFCLKSFQQLNLIQFYSELPVTAWQHAQSFERNICIPLLPGFD